MPEDVAEELNRFRNTIAVSRELAAKPEFAFRMISRRMREVCNTSYHDLPTARSRTPFNPLCLNPRDLDSLGLREDDRVNVISDSGRIPAIVKPDPTRKPGVVSMTHGFGGIPWQETDYQERGASVSRLISLDRDCEPLQAMPRMSGIPVRIEAARSN